MINGKNICIIGAGIGGLTAGALLIKQGFNVTIFEKENLVGGRALSLKGDDLTYDYYKQLLSHFSMNIVFSNPPIEDIFNKHLLHGYQLDFGFHAIGGGATGIIQDIFTEFNDNVEILESNTGYLRRDGIDFPFLSSLDKLKIFPRLFRLLFASEKTMKKMDNISMTETIKKYGKGKLKIALEVFSRSITTVNNLDRISTGEMLRAQRNLVRGSKPVGYPKGGLRLINKKLAEYIVENGGRIYLSKQVNKIIFKDNKAIGIMIDDKEYFFDVIISNILVQDLFKIADERNFPGSYVKKIKSLTATGSLCAYYSLKNIDQNIIGKTYQFIERDVGVDGNDVVGIIDFMTAVPESNLAPQQNYLIQAYIICTPDEAKNIKVLEKLKELLDKNLKLLIPDYKSHLNWVIYPAIWHLDGVAKTIDNEKPDIITPIENLYLIGDCVKAPGIGINCAVNSSRILTEILQKKYGL
jgi:phytoene dehydrogenase-like protein